MSTVRFFFEDTKNYGHQSHTIQLAERILKGDLIKNIGTVEFVYEEKEQGKNNERIKQLMSKYDYDKEKNEYIINIHHILQIIAIIIMRWILLIIIIIIAYAIILMAMMEEVIIPGQ